ncbi:MAG: type II toxin-antitoxin system HicB family antitoxin [Acidobacteria bacterium]|nr:type II toxin-antitoxin system HicB family antitoxin [Acidobacteriota bacterium]
MEYPAKFVRDKESGGFVVTFPDVPEAITQGDTGEEAVRMAEEALELALTFYTEANQDLPKPGPLKKGMRMVGVTALSEAKFMLYSAMRSAGIRKVELARRLGCSPSQVDRLLDIRHRSKLDRLQAAFAAIGKRLSVRVVDRAA